MTAPARTLLLMRHAKSEYPAGVADHKRPLAPRGIREAGLAGEWLRANVPAVDVVLCSTATRTRQTLARTDIQADIRYADALYDSRPGTVLGLINGIGEDVETLLVVGHEPTTSALVLALAGSSSNPELTEEVSSKYPTSAIAVLQIDLPWKNLEVHTATLVDFHVPR